MCEIERIKLMRRVTDEDVYICNCNYFVTIVVLFARSIYSYSYKQNVKCDEF